MLVRAKVSFAGTFSMHNGQEMECNDEVVLQDLLRAGYIEEVKQEKPKKGVKADESK